LIAHRNCTAVMVFFIFVSFRLPGSTDHLLLRLLFISDTALRSAILSW
jgi:hypothetical protein